MGMQDGLIQLKGRVGNVTFYKTKEGYAARKSSGVDGNKIRNNPSYARTRENMAEFQQAMKATKIFRAAFADAVKVIGDGGLARRLSSLLSRLLRQDTVNTRGARVILPITTGALQGFEFNQSTSLTTLLKIPFTAIVERSTGSISVDVPAFSPKQLVSKPDGATHFILQATAAELDFAEQKFISKSAQSPPIGVDDIQQEAILLANTIPGSTKPLFLAFGISFVQMINGISYPLKTSHHAVMQVVKVDTGVTS
ncbi:MAG: hypothetical protein ABJA70_09215 [Chryseolinea sp.]